MAEQHQDADDATGNATDALAVECLPNGALAANAYLLVCRETRAALLLDPGAAADELLQRVAALGVTVVGILHTHGHFDHISATEEVLAGLAGPVPLLAHPADAYLYTPEARAVGLALGYPLPATYALPTTPLADGHDVAVGTLRARVLHTPGHTPGSISLLCGGVCFSGDTLFRRGIGRTDLPGGDEEAIYQSIATRLYTLPPEVVVYPGHGPSTTIGEERRANPYVRA